MMLAFAISIPNRVLEVLANAIRKGEKRHPNWNGISENISVHDDVSYMEKILKIPQKQS